jgi:hypothetical protein
MSVRLVSAPVDLQYDLAATDPESYEREYHRLSETDEDPISQWLKRAKAKGDTADSDPVMLNLMVELHRKIDNLERLIKKEEPPRLPLPFEGMIESIGYAHFQLKTPDLKPGAHYYGRIDMPVYPRRDIAVFFVAENESLARIERIHDRDEKEWAAYLTARERVMIREMKGNE